MYQGNRTNNSNDPNNLNPNMSGDPQRRSYDYGPAPFVTDIHRATLQNTNFRTVIWTGNHLQLALMSINPGEDIGVEMHPNVDQFLRIEQGQGVVMMGQTRENLNQRLRVYDGIAIIVPAGTWHNVINTGRSPLKIYTIYAPPQHPRGTVHVTRQEAEEAHNRE